MREGFPGSMITAAIAATKDSATDFAGVESVPLQ
jgi:hypothetical protein